MNLILSAIMYKMEMLCVSFKVVKSGRDLLLCFFLQNGYTVLCLPSAVLSPVGVKKSAVQQISASENFNATSTPQT